MRRAAEGSLAHADALLLEAVQDDFPLVDRPYAAIGDRVGLSEREVIETLSRLLAEGSIRGLGALLQPRRIGYTSALVAARTRPGKTEEAAAVVSAHPRVSHNYLREAEYDLWFTVASPPGVDLAGEVAALLPEELVEGHLVLPALRTFKLRVRFALEGGARHVGRDGEEAAAEPAGDVASVSLSASDRRLLARLERGFPVTARPWAALAEQVGLEPRALPAAVERLKEQGVIRRISAVLRHRKLGVTANGMACFRVPEADMEEAGRTAATLPEVSHCYQRPTAPDWPYGLYAMIHGPEREACLRVADDLAGRIGCREHRVLLSTREFKKQRPYYFEEP